MLQLEGGRQWTVCLPTDASEGEDNVDGVDLYLQLVVGTGLPADLSPARESASFSCQQFELGRGDTLFLPKGSVASASAESADQEMALRLELSIGSLYYTPLMVLDRLIAAANLAPSEQTPLLDVVATSLVKNTEWLAPLAVWQRGQETLFAAFSATVRRLLGDVACAAIDSVLDAERFHQNIVPEAIVVAASSHADVAAAQELVARATSLRDGNHRKEHTEERRAVSSACNNCVCNENCGCDTGCSPASCDCDQGGNTCRTSCQYTTSCEPDQSCGCDSSCGCDTNVCQRWPCFML